MKSVEPRQPALAALLLAGLTTCAGCSSELRSRADGATEAAVDVSRDLVTDTALAADHPTGPGRDVSVEQGARDSRSEEAGPSKIEPQLILHDFLAPSPVPTPSFIAANLAYLETLPIDGLAVYLRKPDLTSNLTASTMTNQPLAPADLQAVLAPLQGLSFTTLAHRFAFVLAHKPADFFDDWSTPIANFGKLAKGLAAAGFRGVFFDNEQYQCWGNYPDCVDHADQHSLEDYQAQATLRGKQVMEAMVAEFPDIVVLTLHGPYVSDPAAPGPIFNKGLAAHNELLGPFFVGFVQGAGPAATVVDGGELYRCRSPADFASAYDYRKFDLPQVATFVPAALRASWPAKVSAGFGLYNKPFGGYDMDPGIMQSTLENAMKQADGWTWLYLEGMTFLKPESDGGAPQAWVNAVAAGRAAARAP